MKSAKTSFSRGTLAGHSGVNSETIRYYEKEGLIEHQSRVSGRRKFNDQAIVTLQFVQLAQAAGFTITETKSLLENHRQDPSRTGLWRPLVEQKQARIQQQIKDLQQMDRILDQLNLCECSTLKQCVRAARRKSGIDR